MNKKLFKIFLWYVAGLGGLLVLGLVGANLWAAQQEKPIEKELEAFVEQFPPTESNESALKLQELSAPLGIQLFESGKESNEQSNSTPTQSDRQTIEAIQTELTEYLDEQIAKPNNEIDAPPETLQRYLNSKADAIAAIRNHVLNQEIPNWETDITWVVSGDASFPLPSFVGLVNLQKILALDILEKQRLGDTKGAAQMMEVSWKLNQSQWRRPELISQMVALIIGKYQLGVMRKLDVSPPHWQQHLVEHDYWKSMSRSLQGEFLFQFNGVKNMHLYSSEGSFSEKMFLSSPLGKTFFQVTAIDSYQASRQIIFGLPGTEFDGSKSTSHKKTEPPNICLWEPIEPEMSVAWWNIFAQMLMPSFYHVLLKARQYQLDLELTDKILQVKELAKKEGKFPQSIPNLESSVCPGVNWVYQVKPDGSMSISLEQKSQWLVEKEKEPKALPLNYDARLLNQSSVISHQSCTRMVGDLNPPPTRSTN